MLKDIVQYLANILQYWNEMLRQHCSNAFFVWDIDVKTSKYIFTFYAYKRFS